MFHTHTHSNTDDAAKIIGVASIAALIGAITAIIFAPQSGRKTRLMARERIVAMKQKTIKQLPDNADVATDAAAMKAESIADHLQEHLSATVKQVHGHLKNLNDKPQTIDHSKNETSVEDDPDHIRQHGER